MFRRAVLAAISTVAISFPASGVEEANLLGLWEQIATNRGDCPTCRIEFRKAGRVLIVIANNGRQANLAANDRASAVEGAGNWRIQHPGTWVSGRPFHVSFRLVDGDHLAMTMTVNTASGGVGVVQANYRRVWFGM
jgi:hypothetical protein